MVPTGSDKTPTAMDNIEEMPTSDTEEIVNHVTFQDALENQDMPEENTEFNNPPAQTHIQIDDVSVQNNNEENTPLVSRSRQSISKRELNNLRSSNLPGRNDLAPLQLSRSRSPSYQKAKTIFEEALKATHRELSEFDAQNYHKETPENLHAKDIRPRYRKLRMREQALILASEDLCPLLEKSGLIHESRTVQEQVNSALVPITNIKFTFHDFVSVMTDSVRNEPDADLLHHRTTPINHNSSPGIWSTNTALLQDRVCSSSTNQCPTNTDTTNVLSGGISSTIAPSKHNLMPHYHAVVSNSPTCMNGRMITTPCATSNQQIKEAKTERLS